ncbi:MAG: hypothetical protein HFJ75_06855 [Eggerthellaceae bacterium]|nr:hypothetical protein [Eggerthellaceae bacterium]
MWGEFFFSFALGAMLLLVPGVLPCRGAGMGWPYALAVAPGCSIAVYSLTALVFSLIGVPLNGAVLLLMALVIAGAVGAVLWMMAHKGALGFRAAEASSPSEAGYQAWGLGLAVVLGVLVALVVLVKPFADPAMPPQAWDNVFHFGTVRAFLDSGDWSFLNVSQYKTMVDLAADPFPGMRFYPAGWHVATALVADLSGVSVVVAANAVNALFAGAVFPAGMFLLMSTLFPEKRMVVAMGSVSCLCFAAFPWALYSSWQLFPNAAATAVLPSFLALVLAMTGRRRADGSRRRQLATPAVFCFLSLGVLQPNALFSAAVLLMPYCVWRATQWSAIRRLSGWRALAARMLAALSAGGVAIVAWMALYHAPFMQSVVNYHWDSYATVPEALRNALSLAVAYNPSQWVLAAFVVVGAIVALRRPRTAWLSVSYILALLIFVVTTATEGPLKQVLGGFWYTDPCRVGALLAFAAMPLAALGLASCCAIFAKVVPARLRKSARFVLGAVLGILCFCGSYFVPVEQGEGEGRHLETPFEFLVKQNAPPEDAGGSEEARPYGEAKAAFAEEVKAIVGDAVVINQPYDGSMYLYGVDGIHLLYRYMSGYGEEGEASASRIIREHLNLYATDPEVQEAVRRTQARYVLLLSADGGGIGRFTHAYRAEQWEGINAIDPDTPGFTLVLARGNMRLYRIDGTGDASLLTSGEAQGPSSGDVPKGVSATGGAGEDGAVSLELP